MGAGKSIGKLPHLGEVCYGLLSSNQKACSSCGLTKSAVEDFHSKGKRHEAICKTCSNQRRRQSRFLSKVKASPQRNRKQVLANPSISTPPMTNANTPANQVAFSGDPWAIFSSIDEGPIDSHQREHVRQTLSQFFELLAEMRVDTTTALLRKLENES